METLTERTGLKVELWLSFVSMLRSYAAASNLNLSRPVRIEEASNSLFLVAAAARLEMHFAPDTGEVRWSRQSESRPVTGTFKFLPEGAISINGATKDLDHAAIDFIASVTAEGKGSR
jgi:hypothetical protein